MKEPKLLPPPPEIHFCLLKKYALDRSLTRAAVLAKFLQISLVSWISQ
jgi:hypothetical protein